MGILEGRLPDWSKTVDPNYRPDYSNLKIIALQFLSLAPQEQKAEIEAYSKRWCFPEFDLGKASGLYLLLRIVFVLPSKQPREKAKVFGSWLHPSIGEDSPYFDLAWPVLANTEKQIMTVERCQGYAGRPYNAAEEYAYFIQHFPLRAKESIEGYSIH